MSNKRKAKDAREAGAKVWRIYHFKERFEMDSYVRQGGLDYIRMFVTATTKDKSNESTAFLQQLEELEHYYPEQRDAYEGRFWRIGRLTATQEDWLRGYLLDADQQPLSVAKVAARLHLSLPVMKQTVAALKRVGLLEEIDCPVFERPVRDGQQQAEAKKTARKGKGGQKASRSRSSKAASKAISNHFETFQNVSENSKSIQESKNNRNRNTNLNKDPRTSSSDPTNPTEKDPRTSSSEPTNPTEGQAVTQREDNAQGQAVAQGPSGIRTAISPTTTPPICPTSSDPGGPRVIPIHPPPPRPVYADEPTHVSHAVAGIRRRCNQAANVAGREIYAVLGSPWVEGSREAAQEVGCFAAAFEKVLNAGLSPPQVAELWESLTTEARRLRKIYAKSGGYKSAAKVWCAKAFPGKLAARQAGVM